MCVCGGGGGGLKHNRPTLSQFSILKTHRSTLLNYIKFVSISDTDIDWVDLADDIKHEYFVIDNLRPSHGYKFRVCAMSQFGWSIPSIPSPIAMTPSTGASKAEFYDVLQMLQVIMLETLTHVQIAGKPFKMTISFSFSRPAKTSTWMRRRPG